MKPTGWEIDTLLIFSFPETNSMIKLVRRIKISKLMFYYMAA